MCVRVPLARKCRMPAWHSLGSVCASVCMGARVGVTIMCVHAVPLHAHIKVKRAHQYIKIGTCISISTSTNAFTHTNTCPRTHTDTHAHMHTHTCTRRPRRGLQCHRPHHGRCLRPAPPVRAHRLHSQNVAAHVQAQRVQGSGAGRVVRAQRRLPAGHRQYRYVRTCVDERACDWL